MNTYLVMKTKQNEYDWLVIATSYISPLTVLDDLGKELNHVSGKVLFDLTLINGTASNRYISATLYNGSFVKKSFKSVPEISKGLSCISREFFVEHPSLVDSSVLSKSMKYLLKTGAIL